jgi:hypothetical protein
MEGPFTARPAVRMSRLRGQELLCVPRGWGCDRGRAAGPLLPVPRTWSRASTEPVAADAADIAEATISLNSLWC